MTFVRPLVATAVAVMVGVASIPSNVGAQRQISNVEWGDWQKNDLYLARFGKAYSVGMATLPRTGPAFFVIYQVKNVSQLVIDAKCEVKASSSGKVAYSLDQ